LTRIMLKIIILNYYLIQSIKLLSLIY